MWSRDFTDTLLALKRGGRTFEQAYKAARQRHGVDAGVIGGVPKRLTDPDPEAWWRDVCREAWENAPARSGGPSRLHLLPGLMGAIGYRDESRPARRIGSRAA
jgi:hypothetical protein